MRDFSGELAELAKRLAEVEAYLGLEALRSRLAELGDQVAAPDLWEDPERARDLTTQHNRVAEDVRVLEHLEAALEDAETLYGLGLAESDDSVEAEVASGVSELAARIDELELRSLFSGEHDEADAIFEVHAGSGGTDAQDWAETMLRMYLRWAERRGYAGEVEEVSPGQEAGILSATVLVKGRFAYGLLSAEQGVHKLIRISPFGAHRRETSHASLSAVPFLAEDVQVDIDEKDLRIDTYRSSGAGGQHVNVTDSAVRITHLPTNTVVSCQNERSQHQNRAVAMQILAAKLAELRRQERAAELDAISGPQANITRGNHFRTYTLHPYQLVKDDRTKHERGDVQAVLDGDVDSFMYSYLRWRRSESP